MSMIHYTIEICQQPIADGQTPCPPSKGDYIEEDNMVLRVLSITWKTAGSTLGDGCARAWAMSRDHIYATISCEIVQDTRKDK